MKDGDSLPRAERDVVYPTAVGSPHVALGPVVEQDRGGDAAFFVAPFLGQA